MQGTHGECGKAVSELLSGPDAPLMCVRRILGPQVRWENVTLASGSLPWTSPPSPPSPPSLGFVGLLLLLAAIAIRSRRGRRPGYRLLIAFPAALLVWAWVVVEEAL